jgi:hypothetical protein
MRGRRAIAMIVVVDFLAALALMQQAIIARSTIEKHPPAVTTFGQYAVTVTWPGNRPDDVDTYLRDPQGGIVWYASPQVDALQLEHDDIAVNGSGYGPGRPNEERVVIRDSAAGEYVTNVQMYQRRDTGPVPVTVQLWDLRGNDRMLLTRTVALGGNGDEKTAFRFVLDARGRFTGSSTLPVSLIQQLPGGPS